MTKKMTDAEYAAGEGQECPHCRSSNLRALSDGMFDRDEASQSVKCLDCGERWVEVFTLTGYRPG